MKNNVSETMRNDTCGDIRSRRLRRRVVTTLMSLALIFGMLYTPAFSAALGITGTGAPVAAAKKKKPVFNAKKALKNVKITYEKKWNGVLATFENNYKFKLDFSCTIDFEDNRTTVLKSETIVNEAFAKKAKMVYFFKAPVSNNNEIIAYNAFVPHITVKQSTKTNYTSKINVYPTIEPGQTKVLAMNLAPRNLSSINVTFVFYDAAGNYMGAEPQFLQCTAANTSREFIIDMSRYDSIPARVEVYKNWAF